MIKFDTNESGYFSGYSKNGSIYMNSEFNLTNKPTKYHKHNGYTWVLDEESLKADLINQVKTTIFTKCDDLQAKLVKNESYSYDAKYLETKELIIFDLKNTRAELSTLQNKNIDELKVLMKEV